MFVKQRLFWQVRVGGYRLEQHAFVLLFHLSGRDSVSKKAQTNLFMMSILQTDLLVTSIVHVFYVLIASTVCSFWRTGKFVT